MSEVSGNLNDLPAPACHPLVPEVGSPKIGGAAGVSRLTLIGGTSSRTEFCSRFGAAGLS